MNNGDVITDNKGYIFADFFDISLYLILSLVFPVVSLIIQLSETQILGLQSVYDILFAEFFVMASFYYDFYSRYRDCKEQTKYVVKVLCYGRTLFLIATVLIFGLMYMASKNLRLDDIARALRLLAWICCYPATMSLIEVRKRLKIEQNRKISKRK